MDTSYENQLNNWVNKEKLGVDLLNSVGTLMYDKGIELVLFRNHLLEIGISELMSLFSYANKVVNREVDVKDCSEVVRRPIPLPRPRPRTTSLTSSPSLKPGSSL